jgi:hypothetical protein
MDSLEGGNPSQGRASTRRHRPDAPRLANTGICHQANIRGVEEGGRVMPKALRPLDRTMWE